MSRNCVKKPLLSQENMKDRITFLADSVWFSGSAELCGVMNQDFSCMLQRGVFEDLVRNTIVNASLPQLSMEEEVWDASLWKVN